jgi:hypothetical protein
MSALASRWTPGIAVLRSTGAVVSEELDGEERTYRVSLRGYEIAIYDGHGVEGSWQLRMDNGWMRYYFNDVDRLQLVYGIHMDVIRINSLG